MDDMRETPVSWWETAPDAREEIAVVVPEGSDVTCLDVSADGVSVHVRLDLDEIDGLIEALQRARRYVVKNGGTYSR